jgi:hypothetical protein
MTTSPSPLRAKHREAVASVKLAYPPGHPERLELLRRCDALALRIAQAEKAGKK